MAIPPVLVLDPEVVVAIFRGSSQALSFISEAPSSRSSVLVLEGLHFDVLDGLVEDNAWAAPLDANLAFELYSLMISLLDTFEAGTQLSFVPKEPFLERAFLTAMSTRIGLNRCIAATVAVDRGVPLLVSTQAQKAELEELLQRPDELTVLCLEELY